MASQAETKGSPPDVAADGEDGSSLGNFASIEDLGQISTTNIEEVRLPRFGPPPSAPAFKD